MRKYIALMGEMSPPVDAKEKDTLQEKLLQEFKIMNVSMENDLASIFILTDKNMFLALWNGAERLMEAIEKIRFTVKPYQVSFGIGIGDITTGIDKTHNLRSDGPAWWEAKSALDFAKKSKRKTYGVTDAIISGFSDCDLSSLVGDSMVLMHAVRQRWTQGQEELVEEIVKYRGFSTDLVQKDLAINLGMDQPSLNKKMKSTLICDYFRTANTIQSLIDKELKDNK